jgi:uncharacterized protein (UPF0262 family)
MKVTIELPDDLVAAVRERARQRGTTMHALLEETLRQSLSEPAADQPYRLELPVVDGRRRPTIDTDSNAEIDAYLDAAEARR